MWWAIVGIFSALRTRLVSNPAFPTTVLLLRYSRASNNSLVQYSNGSTPLASGEALVAALGRIDCQLVGSKPFSGKFCELRYFASGQRSTTMPIAIYPLACTLAQRNA